jgi:hypothetical protein
MIREPGPRGSTDGACKGSVECIWRIERGTELFDDMRSPYFKNPST